jgi:hypothetical protein
MTKTQTNEVALKAADDFVHQLDGFVTQITMGKHPSDSELDGFVTVLRERLVPSCREIDIDAVESAARALASRLRRQVETNGGGDAVLMATRSQVGAVRAVLDAALTSWDRSDELTVAEQQLSAAETDLAKAKAKLSKAVDELDVDLVLRLRGDAEIRLPKRVSQCRQALLKLQLAKEEAGIDLPAKRAAVAQEGAVRAQDAVPVAFQAWQACIAEAEEARATANREQSALSGSRRRMADIKAEMIRRASESEAAIAQAMRRLSGLSSIESAPEEPSISPTSHSFGPSHAGNLIEAM